MDKIKIVLPYIPYGTNTQHSVHWSIRHKENKEIEKDIYWLLRMAFKKPIPKWSKISIACEGYNTRLDYDNFVGACKKIIDSITSALKIIDDSNKYVERHYNNTKKDDKGQRVEITIERRR